MKFKLEKAGSNWVLYRIYDYHTSSWSSPPSPLGKFKNKEDAKLYAEAYKESVLFGVVIPQILKNTFITETEEFEV